MKRERGLTLLELAIVLAVVAVLASLAVPTFAARAARERLAAAAESMAADLTEARFLAARLGRSVHLVARAGDDWCWSVSEAESCDCGQPAACQLRRVDEHTHRRVQLELAQPVAMRPDGTAPAQRVAVLGTAAGDRLAVDLLALGRARICAVAGESPKYPRC